MLSRSQQKWRQQQYRQQQYRQQHCLPQQQAKALEKVDKILTDLFFSSDTLPMFFHSIEGLDLFSFMQSIVFFCYSV